jgi:hypothetical protein
MIGDRPIQSRIGDDPGHDACWRDRLRVLTVDAPDNGFRASLHRRLVSDVPPSAVPWRGWRWLRERRAWLWPSSGLAAGVAAYLLLVLAHGDPAAVKAKHQTVAVVNAPSEGEPGAALPSFQIPSSKVAVIKLAFSAEVAVEDVTFEVKLPDGLWFWSGGQRLADRIFRWPGRLQPGENIIPIAVRGDRPGRYPVLARVEVAGRVLEQRVVMDVREEGT